MKLFVPIKLLSTFTIGHIEVAKASSYTLMHHVHHTNMHVTRTWTSGTLVVKEVEWVSNGRIVYSVSSGDSVYARVTLKVVGDVRGTVEVVVMEDRTFMPDKVVLVARTRIDLRNEETMTITTPTFTVHESLALQGYYVKAYFNDNLVYEMLDKYPPRLKVETK